MKYSIETTPRFDKEFKKLDKYTQRIIKGWIVKNLDQCDNPRLHGKALMSNRAGQWRYRIGDYRIIADIQDEKIVILLLTVAHRSKVYENN